MEITAWIAGFDVTSSSQNRIQSDVSWSVADGKKWLVYPFIKVIKNTLAEALMQVNLGP
jgi:hypothetical protein